MSFRDFINGSKTDTSEELVFEFLHELRDRVRDNILLNNCMSKMDSDKSKKIKSILTSYLYKKEDTFSQQMQDQMDSLFKNYETKPTP